MRLASSPHPASGWPPSGDYLTLPHPSPVRPDGDQVRDPLTVFDDHAFDNSEDFLRFVLTPKPVERASGHWIYRGVGCERDELIPSALREHVREEMHRLSPMETHQFDEFCQRVSEYGVLVKFRGRLTTSGLPIPAGSSPLISGLPDDMYEPEDTVSGLWPPEEWIALAALAQHSGLPTRLLDWTHDALTATYFAASNGMKRLQRQEPRSDRLAVWMLSRSQALLDRRLEIVIPPYHENGNLHAQRGLFSVWRFRIDLDETLDVDRRPINEVVASANDPNWVTPFKRVTLPISFAPNLLVDLERRGVHAGTLFPSYAGAVRAIRESSAVAEWLDRDR